MSEKSLTDLLELAMQQPAPTPSFQVGQTVRILKTLSVNVHAIRHLLGKEGVVDSISTAWLSRRNSYNVRMPSGECEPFEADELDHRYIKKPKPPEPA